MQHDDQSRLWDIFPGLSEIFGGYLAWALHHIFSTMAMDAGRGHFQLRHITSKSGFILDFLATTSEYLGCFEAHLCSLTTINSSVYIMGCHGLTLRYTKVESECIPYPGTRYLQFVLEHE
jgi:hypothetical protein